MTKYLYAITLAILVSTCKNNDLIKKTNKDGSYYIGEVVADSLYNGTVKLYSSSNIYLGYTNFKNGIEHGVSVRCYLNGVTSDSLNFINGIKNGFAYRFDSLHRLKFKTFFFNDRILGHTFEYDTSGKVVNYYFLDFEGNAIYQSWLKDDVPYEEGNLIYAVVSQRLIGNQKKDVLFLYLIYPPFIKSHYELAILDEKNQIISSKKITGNSCFYEESLSDLPKGQLQAIVLHTFNPRKERYDLKISVIQ